MRHDATFARLSDEDTAELRRAESEAEFSNIAFDGHHELRKAWSCTRCGQGQFTARILTGHLKQAYACPPFRQVDPLIRSLGTMRKWSARTMLPQTSTVLLRR